MEVLDRTVQIGSSILLQGITALSQYIDIKPPGHLHTHHINYTDSSSDNFISSSHIRPRLTKFSIGHHHRRHHHGHHHGHHHHDHHHSTVTKIPVADCTSSDSSSSLIDNCVNTADTSNNVTVTNYSNKIFMDRVLEM